MPEATNVRRLADLPDIDDARPLSEDDAECLTEIRDVLERHDALQRFGVALLHVHFDIGPDEVLVESIDHDNRTLTHRVERRSDLAGEPVVGTIWRLDDAPSDPREWSGENVKKLARDLCRNVCMPAQGGHKKVHKKIGN